MSKSASENLHRISAAKRNQLKHKYGLTPEAYDALKAIQYLKGNL